MRLDQLKRKYKYRGGNPGNEQKKFWIWLLLALGVIVAIEYFF